MLEADIQEPVLAAEAVSKSFGIVRAVQDVSLGVLPGEIHGLIGENGAGKSTLAKMFAGLIRPDSGTLRHRSVPIELRSVPDALRRGFVMIHQEFNLVDDLSVAENLCLGREPIRRSLVNHKAMRACAERELARLEANINPRARVGTLSIAQCQLVEIAKALTYGASVLLMDEPTAVLSAKESAALFRLMRRLRNAGVGIVLISHRLDEVMALCDRISVMRDGRLVKTTKPARTSEQGLAEMMVGRKLNEQYPAIAPPAKDPLFEVRDLSVPGLLRDISLTVRRGEVLGLAGLIGAGRTELGEAIVGLRSGRRGSIRVNAQEVRARSVRSAMRAGIVYLSEDRKGRALAIDLGVAENITLANLRAYARPLLRRRKETAAARRYGESLAIKFADPRAPVRRLSGGNQQKVAIAKWLDTEPTVFILDEPTRGIDVGAKREIYLLIKSLAESGKAVLFISSEMQELLGVCHRIAVMRGGEIAGILARSRATEEKIMYLAAGVRTPRNGVPGMPQIVTNPSSVEGMFR